MTTEQRNKNFIRKAGRTILIKFNEPTKFDPMAFSLEGLKYHHIVEKSNSVFLTFDDVPHSLTALHNLRKELGQTVRIKFAYYRIFFKMTDLTNNIEYNTIKTQHTDFVSKNGYNVLYYKLYRKNNEYVGSGEMTFDTKEGFDSLMTEETKQFTLECGVSGTHYRYNRNRNHHISQEINETT
jgi:DNA-directed RNA polymerase subunit L